MIKVLIIIFIALRTLDEMKTGSLKPGAIIGLEQHPGLGGESTSWQHSAIFVQYHQNGAGNIDGMYYWHHWSYTSESNPLRDLYPGFSLWNYEKKGTYSSWGGLDPGKEQILNK